MRAWLIGDKQANLSTVQRVSKVWQVNSVQA